MSDSLQRLKNYIAFQIKDIPTWEKEKLAAARIDELESLETFLDTLIVKESKANEIQANS